MLAAEMWTALCPRAEEGTGTLGLGHPDPATLRRPGSPCAVTRRGSDIHVTCASPSAQVSISTLATVLASGSDRAEGQSLRIAHRHQGLVYSEPSSRVSPHTVKAAPAGDTVTSCTDQTKS